MIAGLRLTPARRCLHTPRARSSEDFEIADIHPSRVIHSLPQTPNLLSMAASVAAAASPAYEGKKFLIGGNWKCNGNDLCLSVGTGGSWDADAPPEYI